MTEEPTISCPKCKGRAARLISAGSGIIFKGSGFYETDYKKKRDPDSKEAPPCAANPNECKGCSLNPESSKSDNKSKKRRSGN